MSTTKLDKIMTEREEDSRGDDLRGTRLGVPQTFDESEGNGVKGQEDGDSQKGR